jgi:DNA-binding NarL/FixJ family response regulator
MPITLLITDDSKILLKTWKYIFGCDTRFQVFATCTSGEEAIEQVQKLRPDIVIMDNNMPGISGIEATALICKSVPETKVVGFSLHNEPSYSRKFMAAGAAGYIEKTASIKEIADALICIYHNQPHSFKERKSEMQIPALKSAI